MRTIQELITDKLLLIEEASRISELVREPHAQDQGMLLARLAGVIEELRRVMNDEPDMHPDWRNKAMEACVMLNTMMGATREKKVGFVLSDFAPVHVVREDDIGEKAIGWDRRAVFIKFESVKRVVKGLDREGRESLFTEEAINGWFEETNGDACDADGEFISTPCWDADEDIDDIIESLADCARGQTGYLLYWR